MTTITPTLSPVALEALLYMVPPATPSDLPGELTFIALEGKFGTFTVTELLSVGAIQRGGDNVAPTDILALCSENKERSDALAASIAARGDIPLYPVSPNIAVITQLGWQMATTDGKAVAAMKKWQFLKFARGETAAAVKPEKRAGRSRKATATR